MEHIKQDNYITVFKREFPICDVAQGQIGIPLFCQKGIPLSGSLLHKEFDLMYILYKRTYDTLCFFVI